MDKQIRVTKAQRYNDIIALLNGEDTKYGTSTSEAVEFINHEIGLLAKKNSSTGERKPTATQVENEGYKAEILTFLAEQTEGVTCTDILKSVPSLSNYQVQKVAALVRQLKDAGKVTSSKVKDKTYFALA
jgi:hypothetical protein